jgi:hypothetical protein
MIIPFRKFAKGSTDNLVNPDNNNLEVIYLLSKIA